MKGEATDYGAGRLHVNRLASRADGDLGVVTEANAEVLATAVGAQKPMGSGMGDEGLFD
jgi:hypothetical protein